MMSLGYVWVDSGDWPGSGHLKWAEGADPPKDRILLGKKSDIVFLDESSGHATRPAYLCKSCGTLMVELQWDHCPSCGQCIFPSAKACDCGWIPENKEPDPPIPDVW